MLRYRATTRAMARVLALLYVLASCRALIPGLCATQAAMEAEHKDAAAASIAGAHSCCPLAAPPQDASDKTPAPSVPKVRCAFCELAKGLVTPSIYVTVDLDTEILAETTPIALVHRFASRLWDPSLARDPPLSYLA